MATKVEVKKFEVVKEYAGIKKGKKVGCDNERTIKRMVKLGHWKEVK
jgi:hypothetical protein